MNEFQAVQANELPESEFPREKMVKGASPRETQVTENPTGDQYIPLIEQTSKLFLISKAQGGCFEQKVVKSSTLML